MSNTFIQEAFQNAYLVEDAEEFSLNVSGPDDTESFLDIINADDDEMISDVYDLEAEAKEELKQSYIGKVILDCNVCHSNVFFDKDQITEDEDGLCCVDIECPYCMSNEGYTIIGEVKPFVDEEEPVDEIEDVEVTVSEDEPEIEEVEEEPEEELEEGLKADEVKELRGDEEINGADGPIAAVDELEGNDEIRGPKYTELNEENGSSKKYVVIANGGIGHDADSLNGLLFDSKEEAAEACKKWKNSYDKKDKKTLKPETSIHTYKPGGPFDNAVKANKKNKGLNECGESDKLEECGAPELMEEGAIGSALGAVAGAAITKSPSGAIKGAQIGDAIGDTVGNIFNKDEELTEDIEDVSVSTSDETMTMTTKEDGGVVIETSPNEEEIEEYSGEEMIAPLEPETEVDVEDAIEANDEEEEEIPEDEMIIDDEFEEDEPEEDEFEEFDEESFDELGESYLKRCYENVTSFKTSGITMNENKEFIIEGKIGFDSGNEKDTQFIFSPKTNENGKLKLEGFNKQISKGKKTFKLNCSINDKALICESLNYNYKGKNDLNESVRVYGTVKRK